MLRLVNRCIVFGGCSIFMLVMAAVAKAERPPNMVVVFIDDMGWADFSCFGNEDEFFGV